MTQLSHAYICMDCEDIFDARELANGHCPRCMSQTIWPLTAWVPSAKNIRTPKLKVV